MSLSGPVAETLASILQRRWILIGVGNELRGDDAFGPLLARRLRWQGLPAVDAGTAPENLTGPILATAPEELILADAAEMGQPVGALRLLRPSETSARGPSTHDPGLALFLTHLSARQRMNATILTVQPGSWGFGHPVSTQVHEALGTLLDLFRRHSGLSRETASSEASATSAGTCRPRGGSAAHLTPRN